MAINNIMDIGRRGMQANQKAMETTSHNIANANTEGYSRQRARFETESSVNGQGGMGVKAKEAQRIHDIFVERQIVAESRSLGTSLSRQNILARVQDTLSSSEYRMGETVNDFFNRIRELAANPEQGAMRMGVMQAAKQTAHTFREMNNSLDNIRANVDRQLESEAAEINRLTRDLADLNQSISKFSFRDSSAHELEDKRDLILRDLSQKLGITAHKDDQNQAFVALDGVGILVAGNKANSLAAVRTPENGDKAAGNVELFLKDDDGLHNIHRALKEGELAGMLEVRDKVISRTIGYMDRAAFSLANRVNEVHSQGVGSDGLYGDSIFKVRELDGASQQIEVNEHLLENPSLLAVGYDPEATADNRIALALADIQKEELMPDTIAREGETVGKQTLNNGLNMMIGEVGIRMEEADHSVGHQRAILDQLNNHRESISGVNLEEEAINMAQYQSVFNASAKALKVGTELFDTILEIA